MGRKLILDTGTIIAAERREVALDAFGHGDDPAMAAVSVAELLMGVEMADERRRADRRRFVDRALELIPVIDYTAEIAGVHARLLAHVRRSGRGRGDHDLIIAATAAAENRLLVTTDKAARFAELPGVECLVMPPNQGGRSAVSPELP